jgi:hypothetical protein
VKRANKIKGNEIMSYPKTYENLKIYSPDEIQCNQIFKTKLTIGDKVSIQHCSIESNKTFEGIYIGEINIGPPFPWNPVFFIPQLNTVWAGMESWWGVNKDPNVIKQITKEDIQNSPAAVIAQSILEKLTKDLDNAMKH